MASIVKTWDNFLENTDVAAASNAGRAGKGSLRRYFWSLVFFVGVGFTIYGIAIFFTTYFEYPVTTTVSLDSKQNVLTN